MFCTSYWMILILLPSFWTARVVGNEWSCCRTWDSTVDCTDCNLKSIPLALVDNTTTDLILKNNHIEEIKDGSFKNMTSLRRLVLTGNPPQNLNPATFIGLEESLEHLEMGPDSVFFPASYHKPLQNNVFGPLKSIKILHLYYVYPSEVPSGVLVNLTKLESLLILMKKGSVLGTEFTSLKELRSLHVFARHYWVDCQNLQSHITKKTFATVPGIKKLQMTKCILSIDSDAFSQFTRLSTLILPCNRGLSMKVVSNALSNMNNVQLKTLVLDGSTDKTVMYSLAPELFNSTNFANLTHLSLRDTHLAAIDPEFIFNLPSLRYLNLGTNFIFSMKDHRDPYKYIQRFINMAVEYVDISYLYSIVPPQTFYNTYCFGATGPVVDTARHFRRPPEFIKPMKEYPKVNRTVTRLNPKEFIEDILGRNLPPSLHYIYADHVNVLLSSSDHEVVVNPDNNVLYIDFSKVGLLDTIPVFRGFNKLQGVNASHVGLTGFSHGALQALPSLRYLNLGHNNLAKANLTAMFAGGPSLRWLDLSYSYLTSVPSTLLTHLPLLENVSLSGNPLVSISFDLRNNTKLKHFQLSSCSLVSLHSAFLLQVDELQERMDHNLSLYLSDNRFRCSCSTLQMVIWFQETTVNVVDKEFINCTYKNISVPIVSLDSEKLSEECLPPSKTIVRFPKKDKLYISMPIVSLALIAVTLILIYRFRWHISWHVYKVKRLIRRKLLENKPIELNQLEHKYHAFVSYQHDKDYEWVENDLLNRVEGQWGLTLCIGQRDFIAGRPITENIFDAVESSRKIILVITPAFVSSQWCEFEMQMALVKGRDSLIIVYKEEVPLKNMSKTLRAVMKTINYIEYAQEHEGLFWKRLHNCLTTPSRQDHPHTQR